MYLSSPSSKISFTVADWHRYSVAPPSSPQRVACRVPRVLFLAWIGVKDAEEEAGAYACDRHVHSSWQKKVVTRRQGVFLCSTVGLHSKIIVSQKSLTMHHISHYSSPCPGRAQVAGYSRLMHSCTSTLANTVGSVTLLYIYLRCD